MSASIIGLDIGDARIGVAKADAKTPFPAPLTTLQATGDVKQAFAEILERNHVTTVVVGYPRNQQGDPTAQTKRVEQIVGLLGIPESITVVWQDESLTSVKAEEELKKRGKPYQKEAVDALAATYILNDYVQSAKFKQHHNSTAPATPLADEKSAKIKAKKSFNPIKAALLVVGAVCIAILVAATFWYYSGLSPKTSDEIYSVITVEQGDATNEIATKLQNSDVIKSATVFSLYVRLSGINALQAGSYRLSSSQSVPEIARAIANGSVTTVNVLIPPGLRQDQIVDILLKEGYSKSEIDDAMLAVRDHPVLQGYPASQPIEGYLHPETYRIEPETSVEQLLRVMLDEFQGTLTDEILDGIAAQGLSLDEAVTIASIVQEEVPEPDVQRKVAQVFILRYQEGMQLGADPTFRYAAARFGTVDNPSSPSPYNTRRFTGLPPTPIANFNTSALAAVANPTDSSYVYFVSGDDGITHFATTLDEHEANVAKYCIKGCG